jgi:hypothetical protein
LASGGANDVIAAALPDARAIAGLVAEVRGRFQALTELANRRDET